jgi:hypothetical protein
MEQSAMSQPKQGSRKSLQIMRWSYWPLMASLLPTRSELQELGHKVAKEKQKPESALINVLTTNFNEHKHSSHSQCKASLEDDNRDFILWHCTSAVKRGYDIQLDCWANVVYRVTKSNQLALNSYFKCRPHPGPSSKQRGLLSADDDLAHVGDDQIHLNPSILIPSYEPQCEDGAKAQVV